MAIIDIMMPRMNGYDMLKKLRVDHDIPVMIISAKVQLEDRIVGLDLGADDYITKPFEPLEVTARIKAHLRRYSKSSLTARHNDSNVIVHKELKLDLDRCQLHVGEKTVDLTKIEMSLMEMFLSSPGRVFTKEQIFKQGLDYSFAVDDNTIRVTISRLRDKIGGDRIKTIRGLGYRLEV